MGGQALWKGCFQKVRSHCSKASTQGQGRGERKVYFRGWQPGWLGDGRLSPKAELPDIDLWAESFIGRGRGLPEAARQL